MFLETAKANLTAGDFADLKLLLTPNDLTNCVAVLHEQSDWLTEALVTREEWTDLISYLKQLSEGEPVNRSANAKSIPAFVVDYLYPQFQKAELLPASKLLADLFSIFYDQMAAHRNDFIREWFRFDADIRNIIVALNCRKHKLPIQEQLIGSNELTEKLGHSQANDFGLGNEYPVFEVLSRLTDQPDIIEKEKGYDALKWKWIESRIFFEHFTLAKILGYFIRLRIIYRWIHLSQSVGEKRFSQVLNELENSFAFPEEFALNKR
jgi:hypothetical protein